MAHLSFSNMQLSGLKIPPAPPSLHDMMPIMEEDGFEMSVTVAVNTIVFPEVNVAGFGVTVVAVESGAFCIDVLLLLVNTNESLSAIAGTMRIDIVDKKVAIINKNIVDMLLFNLFHTFRFSYMTYLFFSSNH